MTGLLIFTGFIIILCIGGFVADYIFPRVKLLNRFIDSLPMMQNDEEPKTSRKEYTA